MTLMYFNILKRDLKRKKTMNLILLIFIILSVTFVSSSAYTMTSVMSGCDRFLEISGAEDYFVVTGGPSAKTELDKKLSAMSCVTSVKSESCFYLNQNSLKHGDRILDFSSTGILSSIDDIGIKVFGEDRKELTSVNEGDIYIKESYMEKNGLSVGDEVTVKSGGYTGRFTVRGTFLDVLFGSDMMGSPRFIISQKDFDRFSESSVGSEYDMYKGNIYNIKTSDTTAVNNAVSSIEGVKFTANREIIKTTYIMDLIIAGIFLIVSVCLILVSVVILRFTIGFTISEEYREIGVMKAIGIRNSRIRSLYMIKYLAMAVIGTVAGFAAGIPFGNMMTEQSSKHFISSAEGGILINLFCSLAVLALIGVFAWLSTAKVRKFTPVDAIRSGESGRRYKKKGLLRLSTSRQRPVFFMAMNDILSGFRHFAVMTVTFVIGILLIAMMLNTISTLKSPELLKWFSMPECDLTLEDKSVEDKYSSSQGHKLLEDALIDMEKTLADNGIPAECFCETIFKLAVSKGENRTVSLSFLGTGTTTDMYAYLEGTPPENAGEIAMSFLLADILGVNVGDTVNIQIDSENREFMVSALYQSMNNMGEGIRLHESLEMDYRNALGYFSYMIKYTDAPSQDEVRSRTERIKELYPDYTLRTAGEYLDYSIGGIADMLTDTKAFILIIVMLINILVVVLMEKSFLTKERGEIALLKALGFKNRTLILWQTLRVAILMTAAVLIAVLLTEPVSQLAVGSMFKFMGAKYIIFDVNILESYILYPLIVFAVTILAALVSAFSVRSISSQEVNNIE